MDISTTLARALSLWPDRVAITDGELRLTYRELGRRVGRLAGGLAALGLGRGGVAAVLAPNGHEFIEAYYGAARLGAVLCPINTRLSAVEIATVLAASRATVLVAATELEATIVEALERDTRVAHLLWLGPNPLPVRTACPGHGYEAVLAAADGARLEPVGSAPEDLAHLYFTSGTTGRPKGVMLTHGNVTTHALAAIAELKLDDRDCWLHGAPMFHLADAWATFALTWVGGRHVCLPSFEPRDAMALIETEAVTITNLVPTMLNLMVGHPDVRTFDFRSLRTLLSGGAPIAPETVRRVVATFGCEYVQTYGMTETSPYLTMSIPKAHQRRLPPEERLRIAARTGRPVLGVELRVVRTDGTEVEPDDREVGEIVVRGPTVTAGYLDDPEATADAIVDGWLHTGDLAVVDREGSVDIVDRMKDVIVTGGENVHSVEVENVLYEHPGVLECAVVGVPDEQWGEAVRAVVVARPGFVLDPAELVAFARGRIAHFKAPRAVDVVESLPRTGSGKIAKRSIRDRFWTGLKRRIG